MSMSSELTCSICLEIYTHPLQLSCLHSYCRQCLKDLHDKSEHEDDRLGPATGVPFNQANVIECPDCRRTTRFENSIDDLPKNFILENIAVVFKESLPVQTPPILCSLCETDPKPAVRMCPDCSRINYCVDCLQQFHPLRGAFKTHTLCEPGDSGKKKTSSKSVQVSLYEDSDSSAGPCRPDDSELRDVVKNILDGANLRRVTMKIIVRRVYARYPDFDLTDKKEFIKNTVKQFIRVA